MLGSCEHAELVADGLEDPWRLRAFGSVIVADAAQGLVAIDETDFSRRRLADWFGNPWAVDATGVYGLAGDVLKFLPSGSANVRTVATLDSVAGRGLALADDAVWIGYVGVAGGSADAGAPDGSDASAVDAGTAPFALGVVRVGEPNGAPAIAAAVSEVPPPDEIWRIAWQYDAAVLVANGNDVFMTNGHSVFALYGGAPPAQLIATDDDAIEAITADVAYVYWETTPNLDGCFTCDAAATKPVHFRRVGRTGGAVEEVWSGWGVYAPFAAYGGSLYAVSYLDDVLVRLEPGRSTLVAGGSGEIRGIAVDGTGVYWSVTGGGKGNGRVLRAPP
jgi:hypothetical protein